MRCKNCNSNLISITESLKCCPECKRIYVVKESYFRTRIYVTLLVLALISPLTDNIVLRLVILFACCFLSYQLNELIVSKFSDRILKDVTAEVEDVLTRK